MAVRLVAAAVLILVVAALMLGSFTAVAAPAIKQPDQVASGAAVYDTACATCHGSELEGGRGSILDRATLASYRTADRLVRFVRISMPDDNPGSLSEQEYYDVVAFLLDWNGQNPDGVPLDASTAADVAIPD